MKKISKYIFAVVVFLIVILVLTTIEFLSDSSEVRTTLIGLIGAGAFWRTLEFFHLKELGVSNGLALLQTIVIFPIEAVSEQVKHYKKVKKKREADDLAKQLFKMKKK